MSQLGLLSRVVGALDSAGIPYMVSGSTVSSIQGQPRATHDVDLVVDIVPDDVPALVGGLDDPALYLDPEAVAEAVLGRRMFNLIDTTSADKIDFWPLTDDAFDRSRFERRTAVETLGLRLWISAPEDTILMKLRWARECGGSEKQYLDARSVYEVQAGALDEDYLSRWAETLGVSGELERIRREAEPIARD